MSKYRKVEIAYANGMRIVAARKGYKVERRVAGEWVHIASSRNVIEARKLMERYAA